MSGEQDGRETSITGDGNAVGNGNIVQLVKAESGGTVSQVIQVTGDYHVHYDYEPGTLSRALAGTMARSPKFPANEPYYPLPERDKDITSIVETLTGTGQAPVALITGMGGIGKTALAVEIVRRCAEDAAPLFQVIAWESAKQELFLDGAIMKARDAVIALPELIDSLGSQLLGPDFVHMPETHKEQALKDVWHTTPCLVVVDNLETMPNAQEILLRLLNLLGKSRALITSRFEVKGTLFHVPLRELPEASSLAFLRAEGQRRNHQEIAQAGDGTLREIYQVTKGMPLAMKLVVSQAEVLGLEVALNNLKQGRGEIYSFLFLETWKLLSDTAKQLLLYMGPTSGAVGREELESILGITGVPLDQAIQDLVRLSLLNPQPLPGLKQRGYTIHQLTRYFVVNELPVYWKDQGLL